MRKLYENNVFAYIFLNEECYTPKIEIASDYDSIANFIAQASTLDNHLVRITDSLDRHILDVKLMDFGIFEEFRFITDLDLSDRNHISLKALDYLENPSRQKAVEVLNCHQWEHIAKLKDSKEILTDLNDKVFTNFKLG